MKSEFIRVGDRFPQSNRRSIAVCAVPDSLPIRRTLAGCLALTIVVWLMGVMAMGADFGASALTNDTIINYTQSRVSPSEIIAKINSSATNFDLSPEGVINLKHNGVPDEVLAVMTVASSRSAAQTQSGGDAFGALPELPALSATFATVGASSSPDETRFTSELSNLASPIAEVRNAALAWMLANRESTLPLLRQALAGQDQGRQAAAAVALGRMKDRDSVADLRRLLVSSSRMVRENVADALAALEDTQSIAVAEQALGQASSGPLDGYIRLVGAARLVRASRQLGVILAGNPVAANRAAAAWALAEIGPPAAVAWPSVSKALADDDDPAVRREAARAVASLHDASSAKLLKSACRKDPDVRKITLQAMADYPETVEFLVGVMKLGTDQIAPDELDAARASLQKLTGQDFALDGDRWSQWFTANRSQFAPPDAPDSTGLASTSTLTDLSQLLGGVHPGQSEITAATAPQTQTPAQGDVDMSAWGIVIDSTLIPMAPEVDAAGAAAMPASPLALSPEDFLAAPSSTFGSMPSVPPAPGLPGPEDTGAGSMFRTWSSDPDRSQTPPPGAVPTAPPGLGAQAVAGQPAPAAPPSAPGLAAGETQLWGGFNPGDMTPPSMDDDSFSSLYPEGDTGELQPFGAAPAAPIAASPMPSSLPSMPIVAPQSSSPAPDPGSDSSASSGLRGISLPLPGMSSSSSSSSSSPAPSSSPPAPPLYASPPAEPAPVAASPMEAPASPFGGMDDSSSAFDDPFGDSLPPADFSSPAGGMAAESMQPADTGEYLAPDDFGMPSSPDDDPFAGLTEVMELPVEGAVEAQAPAAQNTGDYNTLIFPGDSFGIGEPYFDQVDSPEFAAPAPSSVASEPLPEPAAAPASLGGLSLPMPTESSGTGPSESEDSSSGSFRLRPPPSVMPPAETAPAAADAGTAYSPPAGIIPPQSAGSQPIFVQPEPGQVVVGEDLFGGLPSVETYMDEDATSSAPLQGLSLPMPTEAPQPDGEPEMMDAPYSYDDEDDEDEDDSESPAYFEETAPVPEEPQTPAPVVIDVSVEGGSEEPAAVVIEVEELGVVGEGGRIVEHAAEDVSPPAAGAIILPVPDADDDSEEGDDEEDEGLVSEVWEDVEETPHAPPPAARPPVASPPRTPAQPSVHNEAQYVIKEIPPGIPVISEDELFTDPAPGEAPKPAAVARPAESKAPEVKPATKSTSEQPPTKRKRNPPRHKR